MASVEERAVQGIGKKDPSPRSSRFVLKSSKTLFVAKTPALATAKLLVKVEEVLLEITLPDSTNLAGVPLSDFTTSISKRKDSDDSD
jgi:hypothetical protein